jgi:hypothetical protein
MLQRSGVLVTSTSQDVVEVEWWPLTEGDDGRWSATRVLYALCHPGTHRVLYLGKADRSTLRCRLRCASKRPIYRHLVEELGVDRVDILVGEIYADTRLTAALLPDVESLLIHRLRPCCNVQSVQSRVRRPGLRVLCAGVWPGPRASFVDR